MRCVVYKLHLQSVHGEDVSTAHVGDYELRERNGSNSGNIDFLKVVNIMRNLKKKLKCVLQDFSRCLLFNPVKAEFQHYSA